MILYTHIIAVLQAILAGAVGSAVGHGPARHVGHVAGRVAEDRPARHHRDEHVRQRRQQDGQEGAFGDRLLGVLRR